MQIDQVIRRAKYKRRMRMINNLVLFNSIPSFSSAYMRLDKNIDGYTVMEQSVQSILQHQ